MFDKSASSITDYLISSDSFDPEHCSSLLQKTLKKKADTVIESIEGYQMTREQEFFHSKVDLTEPLYRAIDAKASKTL